MLAVVGVSQKSVSLHLFMSDHSTVKDGVAEELLSSALRLNVYKCVGAWMGDLYVVEDYFIFHLTNLNHLAGNFFILAL